MLLQAAAPLAAKVIRLVVFSNAFVVANGQSQLGRLRAGTFMRVTPSSSLNGFT
jgi:hypothetical protein